MHINIIIFGYVIVYVFGVEPRVFCQDSNAKPWVPLGFTCPVVCASVMDALDKLVLLDYKKSIKEQLGGKNEHGEDYNEEVRMHYSPNLRRMLSETKKDHEGKAFHVNDDTKNIQGIVKLIDENGDTTTNCNVNAGNSIENTDNNKYNKDESQNFDNNIRETKEDENNKEKLTDFDMNAIIPTVIQDKIKYYEDKTYGPAKFQSDRKYLHIDKLKILENVKNVKGILRRSGNIADNDTKYNSNNYIETESERCWYLEKFIQKTLIGKIVRRKCSRRSNFDAKFVIVMTNVLNKYVDTEFRFTNEMTEILLENIFGKDTDLRNNIFDVSKLLKFLRKSVDRHKIHSHKHVITLKSRHCLTISMPGCFCRSGFVESSGQCVKPEDCVSDSRYMPYLSRIVIV